MPSGSAKVVQRAWPEMMFTTVAPRTGQPSGFAVDVVGGEVKVDAVLDGFAFGYLMERQAGAGVHEVAREDDGVVRVRAVGNLTSESVGPELRDPGCVMGVEADAEYGGSGHDRLPVCGEVESDGGAAAVDGDGGARDVGGAG